MEWAERVPRAARKRRLTVFERGYLCLETFLPPLHGLMRRRLLQHARRRPFADVLDVGGRKSHYTIGVPAHITISDLERTTEQQSQLDLGVTSAMINQTRMRRSNVHRFVVDDMTQSALPDNSFDCVVAVEVLEHVEADMKFVHEVHRVLKPGGVFLMSTPNGDWVKVTNPDHKRHYKREQLQALLASVFDDVQVEYAIRSGTCRTLGLRPWSKAHPIRTIVSMLANVGNRIQSAPSRLKTQPTHTKHLIATAHKQERTRVAGNS
jgi:2-polyprenyl-3-methyl-5-hydroxy-6-metoxy-1,4-benzoquinol methylase